MMGKIWWKLAHSTYVQSRLLEHISWQEFKAVCYAQYFSTTVQNRKRYEFLAVEERDMIVVEYQTIFFTLERFALGSFTTKKERAKKFVTELRLRIQSVVSSFACATLTVVVMRALEVENDHERYHIIRRSISQFGDQYQRPKGQGQQSLHQQRRRADSGRPSFQQPLAYQLGGFMEYPVGPHGQRRHLGAFC